MNSGTTTYYRPDAHPSDRTSAVRAQFILGGNGETRYFPAPGIKDHTRYGPAYAKADFKKTDQPFWADEQTHKTSSHE